MSERDHSEIVTWAQLLFEEWKFRQAHCWRLLQLYGVGAVTVSIVPYLLPSMRAGLGDWVLIFPIGGVVIAAVVMWLFAAEYEQCRPVLQRYRALQREAGERFSPWDRMPRHRIPIGKAIPPLFFVIFLAASVGNALILIALNCPHAAQHALCTETGVYVGRIGALIGRQ